MSLICSYLWPIYSLLANENLILLFVTMVLLMKITIKIKIKIL